MTFRVPDVQGYQPMEAPISPSYAYDSPLTTCLPLSTILEEAIHKEQVTISTDPGRYLCNYVYYKALLHQQSKGLPLHSLFIHVPSFDVISKDLQVGTIKQLITSVCTTCLE
jgi:pyroglutamyl-peptidase